MKIYPDPSKVTIMPTTSLAEVTRTRAPAVLAELAYHDNPEDAEWIKNNINAIAKNLVEGLTIYFGIPFVDPFEDEEDNDNINGDYENEYVMGTVATKNDRLNIRRYPSLDSEVHSHRLRKAQNLKYTVCQESGTLRIITVYLVSRTQSMSQLIKNDFLKFAL